MYKAVWDSETGGVTLQNYKSDDTLSVSPRPVFYEELDLLGLDKLPEGKAWHYPHCKEPLLWACNKQYYYKGQFVFEAKGANLYDSATIILQPGAESLTLDPVNVKEMLERCKDAMFHIESEAIEFIRSIYEQYSRNKLVREKAKANQIDFEALAAKVEKSQKRKMAIVKEDCESFDIMPMDQAKDAGKQIYQTTAKIDVFLASFSGGKDSQVVLDLCTRALPPEAFQVIYSDTGYELPTSLSLYKEVQRYYRKKFPTLQFRLAKNHESVLNYWDQIGTPSDTHRWCCTIMKTAPLYRMLKVEGTNKQAKVLTFDGVRAEESVKRSNYSRTGKGKHTTVFNAHPIIAWDTVEIFLYLLEYHLPINLAYRVGKSRVGCIVCPFSTSWDDMIVNKVYLGEAIPFIDKIIKWSKEAGVKDIDTYLKDRKWKIKATGDPVITRTKVEFPATRDLSFVAKVTLGKKSIYDWLPSLSSYTVTKGATVDFGELKYSGNIFPFKLEHDDSGLNYTFTVQKASNDGHLLYYLRRIVNKSAYCLNCEACEVDCPTGALSVVPSIKIDINNCIHCHKCLDFHDKGCIAADCIRMIEDTNKKVAAKVQGYKTFGMHEEWLSEYFAAPEEFWGGNSLGTAQVDSFKAWLKDSEIVDSKNNITSFGEYIQDIYQDDMYLAWELILINLTYNSFIVNWFAYNIKIGQPYDRKILVSLISEQGTSAASKTIDNAVAALIQLFKNTPIGEDFRYYTEFSNNLYVRAPYDGANEKAIAYALYRYAEMRGTKTLRVTELYEVDNHESPIKIFGITKTAFSRALQTLSTANNRVLVAELNMGLDHITLRDDLDPLSVLKSV